MILRIPLAVIVVVLTMCCAHKDAGKGLNKSSERKGSGENPATGAAAEQSFLDSSVYIGYVDYFPETQEFYTSLFFKEGREYPDDDLLAAKLDSVILYDEDWGRERLPIEDARSMLVLSGLDSLSVYTRNHELICECPLTRVEYLWNGLENYFIAVFRHDDPSFEQTGELYGIGTGANLKKALVAEEVTDAELNRHLAGNLHLNNEAEWRMRHYRLSAPQRTYSIISTYSMERNEAESYLTVLQNDSIHILSREVNNFHYLNILPLPFELNGQPLLLISAGYPSSDVLWDYLAAFDDTAYQPLEYNRLPLHLFRTFDP